MLDYPMWSYNMVLEVTLLYRRTSDMTTQTQDQGSWIKDGDFKFINEGSIMLVQPMNDDASQWLTQTSHAAYEAGVEWQFFGRSLVIEPRYIDNILCLLNDEGWRVS